MNEALDLRARAWAARREGRSDDAMRDMTRALELAREAGDPATIARVLGGLGHLVWDEGRIDEARAAYAEAVEIVRRGDDEMLLAHALRHLGDVEVDAERPAAALPLYEEALALYRSHRDPPPLDFANALRRMAVLREALGETDRAIAFWGEARAGYATLGLQEGVDEAEARLAALSP